MENKTLDLLSRLLASENITIIRDRVPTASFDIVNRVLRLPMLLNMSEEEETMLAFHEVSHALFTDDTYVEYNQKERSVRPHFDQYLNVVEDVRVERLFKEKFPGARKDFFKGYKSFNERDFFKLSGRNVNTLVLIDRINVFYKIGYTAGVKFTAEERQFIAMIDKCETLQEVYETAIAIYEFSAKKEKERKENAIELPNIEDEYDFDIVSEFDESDEADGEPEESGEAEQTSMSSSDADPSDEEEPDDVVPSDTDIVDTTTDSELLEEEQKEQSDTEKDDAQSMSRIIGNQEEVAPASETQEAFDENVQENVQVNGREINYFLMEGNVEPKIISHRTIVEDFRAMNAAWKFMNNAYAKYRVESNKMVAHLVKEFEMRKAAKRYARTQTSRTGELSMNKIAKFQVSDDLFKKLDIVADDTSHGFMMLLDWSGSMQHNMQDTIGQVITLAAFCRRANIPFTVYAFSDNLSKHFGFTNYYSMPKTAIVNKDNFGHIDAEHCAMLNFFNSKMSNADFETVAQFLYNGNYRRRLDPEDHASEAPYALNGTPLTSALLFVDKQIEIFKRANNVQKMTLITLTDGEGNTVDVLNSGGRHSSSYNTMRFLRHPKSNKTIPISKEVPLEVGVMRLLSMSHPDVKFIGFFITNFTYNQIRRYIMRSKTNANEKQICNQGRKDGFYEFPVEAYDKMFFIKSSSDSMDVELSDISEKMTAAQIARKLTGAMSSSVKSRVVLTKFIDQIA